MTDPVNEWTSAQRRVADFARTLDPDAAGRKVPACPAWTVQNLLAHMIGLDADILSGDVDDDHNEQWTQKQVDARADRSVAELVDEWDGLADGLRTWIADNNAGPLGDVIIHEQDLRGALDLPGARDSGGVAVVRDFVAGSFGDAVSDLPVIALQGDTWHWTSGDGEVQTELRATDFDLFRALTSRRTADQLRSYTVRGDIAPYLDALGALGPLPDQPLPE